MPKLNAVYVHYPFMNNLLLNIFTILLTARQASRKMCAHIPWYIVHSESLLQ